MTMNTIKTKKDKQTTKPCSCTTGLCPLNGLCNKECVVYQATVHTNTEEKVYRGITEGEFKLRWNTHQSNIRLPNYRKSTDLSEYIWSLKDKGEYFRITWKILESTRKLRIGDRFCPLCVAEKRHILNAKPETLLNTRTEFISKCRHKNKFILANLKTTHNVDILRHTVNHNTENVNFNTTHPIPLPGKPRRRKEQEKSEVDKTYVISLPL